LTRFVTREAESISHQYKLLLPLILTKYRDGIVVTHLMDTSAVTISKDFYPKWYLQLVGYFVPGFNGPGTILTSTGPGSGLNLNPNASEMLVHHVEYIFVLYIFIGMLVGYSTHYYVNCLGKYIMNACSATTKPTNANSASMEMKNRSYSYMPISGVDQIDVDMSERPFSVMRDDI